MSSITNILDEWLRQHAPFEETLCLPNTVKVYFLLTHPRAREEFEHLRDTMTAVFGGCTSWEGQGTWCEAEPCTPDRVVVEDVVVLESAHRCTDGAKLRQFAEALSRALRLTDQSYLGIRGDTEFYGIPAGALIMPNE